MAIAGADAIGAAKMMGSGGADEVDAGLFAASETPVAVLVFITLSTATKGVTISDIGVWYTSTDKRASGQISGIRYQGSRDHAKKLNSHQIVKRRGPRRKASRYQ